MTDLETIWAPRALSILRIVAALLFIAHGSAEAARLPRDATCRRRRCRCPGSPACSSSSAARCCSRPLHPPGRLRALRRDGGRLLHGARAAELLPGPERRRRGDPLLLRLPLPRLRRSRRLEPRRAPRTPRRARQRPDRSPKSRRTPRRGDSHGQRPRRPRRPRARRRRRSGRCPNGTSPTSTPRPTRRRSPATSTGSRPSAEPSPPTTRASSPGSTPPACSRRSAAGSASRRSPAGS